MVMVPSINIDNAEWEALKHHINSTYPRESFTHEQTEFVRKHLLQNNGKCDDLNKLWITYFVQNLIMNMDENWSREVPSLSQQLELLHSLCCKAMLGFYEDQHVLRLKFPRNQRSEELQRMMDVHPNVVNFPVEFCVDVGRFLKVHKYKPEMHRTIGSEEELLFEKVYQRLQNTPESMKEQLEKHVSESVKSSANESESEWTHSGTDDTYLRYFCLWSFSFKLVYHVLVRLCTYKVWCEKYEGEEEWSPNKMVNEWLQEAIGLYNHVSYHWPNCKIKHFSQKQFGAIQATAIHTWLQDVSSRAGISHNVKRPTTNWISDWHSSPVFEKRHEWENYFCSVIMRAKNIAKVLHHQERLSTHESTEMENPAKKAKTSSETYEQSNMNPIEYLTREIHKIDQRILRLEAVESLRHTEVLREIAGHMKPIRTHLMQLNQSQHHLQQTVDHLHV